MKDIIITKIEELESLIKARLINGTIAEILSEIESIKNELEEIKENVKKLKYKD